MMKMEFDGITMEDKKIFSREFLLKQKKCCHNGCKNCPYPLCEKCGDSGWVWWYELDHYEGPASDPYDCYSDDTRYPCDKCNR